MKKKTAGILLFVVAAFALSFSTILLKYIPQLTSISAGQTGILRFLIAAPIMWLFGYFRSPEERKIPRGSLKFVALGLVFAVSSFSAVFALELLSASIYNIVVYIYPTFVVLFSLLMKRPVPRLFWIGLPLSMMGLFLVTFKFNTSITVDPWGIFITIINALALSSYMILSDRLFQNGIKKSLGTKLVLTGSMIAGFLMIPIVGFRLPDTFLGWVLVFSLGIVGTVVPILAMNTGLQYLGAARGSIIVSFQPVLTILFATIFLDESLSLQQWLGGALVVTGILLIQLSSDNKQERVQ